MRPASGLLLVALGAILAFAVTGHPSFLNVQVVGWVIMLTGVAAMVIPRRGYGWLRRRMVLRRRPGGRPVVSHSYPAAPTPSASEPPTIADPPQDNVTIVRPDGGQRGAERLQADWAVAEWAAADWEATEQAAAPGEPGPAEEVVEEYIEE